MSGRVDVVGLRELRRDLRRLADDGPWRSELRDAGYQAADIVAGEAQRTAESTTNPRMGSKATSTIRALAGQMRATVAGGTAAVRHYMGHEFGSVRYPQFPRPKAGGYHLYPAIVRKRDEVIEAYSRALDRITERYF